MNRRLIRIALFVAILAAPLGSFANEPSPSARTTQSGPIVLQASFAVSANRLLHYWKVHEQDNYWSWMPEMSFYVTGPINTGSAFVIDFTNEAGAPWYSVECETNATPAGQFAHIGTPAITTHVDKRTTLATGTFGFTIRLKSELIGTNKKFFSGKFNVTKFHIGNNLPAFKNQFEYVVDQDWNLPIGYLSFNLRNDQNIPPLNVSMWFRGRLANTKLPAYLFYNGKQIASTKDQSGSADYDVAIFPNAHEGNTRWERWTFAWGSVRGWNTDTSSANITTEIFFVNKNPGEYEVKVLRYGDLPRSAKFTVLAHAPLVANGIAQKNNLGGYAIVLPVKVIGGSNGQWDANAWKTDAFYGNPLSGFSAP